MRPVRWTCWLLPWSLLLLAPGPVGVCESRKRLAFPSEVPRLPSLRFPSYWQQVEEQQTEEPLMVLFSMAISFISSHLCSAQQDEHLSCKVACSSCCVISLAASAIANTNRPGTSVRCERRAPSVLPYRKALLFYRGAAWSFSPSSPSPRARLKYYL